MESTKDRRFEVEEIQLSYKPKVKASLRPKINSSKDANSVLRESWDEDKLEFVEQFNVILLGRANRVLGICEVTTGVFPALWQTLSWYLRQPLNPMHLQSFFPITGYSGLFCLLFLAY